MSYIDQIVEVIVSKHEEALLKYFRRVLEERDLPVDWSGRWQPSDRDPLIFSEHLRPLLTKSLTHGATSGAKIASEIDRICQFYEEKGQLAEVVNAVAKIFTDMIFSTFEYAHEVLSRFFLSADLTYRFLKGLPSLDEQVERLLAKPQTTLFSNSSASGSSSGPQPQAR